MVYRLARRLAASPLAALLALAGLPASAQTFQGMQADQGLNTALQAMLSTYGGACQQTGDASACNLFTYFQQTATYMMGASDACLQGDQQACQAYSNSYQLVQSGYANYTQTMGAMAPSGLAGGMAPGGGVGAGVAPLQTPQQQLDAIQQFGEANRQAFQQHLEDGDAAQSQFLDYINH